MDVTAQQPVTQTEETISNARVAAFGITSQGASHRKHNPPVPCQDSHGMRWMEQEELLIAAIADGVGSCSLSHWGAYTAVNTVLSELEKGLRAISGGKKLTLNAADPTFRQTVKDLMLRAFTAAQEAVENLADTAQPPQPVYAFQSTLTIAIYDGCCLYHGHVGDDGIVAQLPDGTVHMTTRRLKGEESSSVYPLQSGSNMWSFGLVPQASAFVMATDGVLDSFVETHPDYFGIHYFDGICYSFMEDAVYTLAKPSADSAQQALEEYRGYLNSPGYRQHVTDDLTLIAVVSREGIARAKRPNFNRTIWDTIGSESRQARRNALNHAASGRSAAPMQISASRQETAEPCAVPQPSAPTEAAVPEEPAVSTSGSAPVKRILSAAAIVLILALLAGFAVFRFLLPAQKAAEDAERRTEALQQENRTLTAERDALAEENETLKADNAALTESVEALNRELEDLKQAEEVSQEAPEESEEMESELSEQERLEQNSIAE